jgi:DNA-binding transcriptional ArsR family regulator
MRTTRGASPASSCETDDHARRLARREPSPSTLGIAAQMFEAAGSPQRLQLLLLLRDGGLSVAEIAAKTKRQPSLVFAAARALRVARLVRGVRQGRFVVYELFDRHARTFVDSAIAHARRIASRGSAR